MLLKRNNSIEFFRFLFIITICLMHFSNSYFQAAPYFEGAYIGTEFFFIVSGFLLMHKFSQDQEEKQTKGSGAFRYSVSRMKKLYPHYLFSFFVIFIFTEIVNRSGFFQVISNLCASLWELTFLQISGLKCFGLYNYPAWYVSAMLIAGYFLYCLLEFFHEKFVRFGIPLFILAVYTFFSKNTGNMDVWGGAQILNLSDAVVRAFGAMGIGVLCYEGSRWLQDKINTGFKKYVFGILEILCYVVVLIMGTLKGHSQNDFYLIAVMALGVLITFTGQTITDRLFSSKVFSYLGSLSYPMFLNQLFIINMFTYFYKGNDYKITLFVYLVVLTVYSAFTNFLVSYMQRIRKKQVNRNG